MPGPEEKDLNEQEKQQESAHAEGEAPQSEQDADAHAQGESADSAPDADAEQAEPAANAESEQIAALKDQVLRSMAEVENIKRRAQRDVENAHKFAVEGLIKDLFPVLDSLEKAVETAQATSGAEAIAEGVSLSLKLFIDTLGKSGVEQIDPLGQPFDPQEHEAMTMVPNPDAEPNSVMDVMAKGYKLNGRLVRAAKVIVVQGS